MLTTSSTPTKLIKAIQSSLLLMAIAGFDVLDSGIIAEATNRVRSDDSANKAPTIGEISLVQKRQFFPLKDGTYLYGQSPQREELGQEYLVFKVNAGKATGAFYQLKWPPKTGQ